MYGRSDNMTESEISEMTEKMAQEALKVNKKKREQECKEFKEKLGNVFLYVVGSVALTIVACATIPLIMKKVTGVVYKISQRLKVKKDEENDDWGPVMEKKKK